jgi:hypothetical protein
VTSMERYRTIVSQWRDENLLFVFEHVSVLKDYKLYVSNYYCICPEYNKLTMWSTVIF